MKSPTHQVVEIEIAISVAKRLTPEYYLLFSKNISIFIQHKKEKEKEKEKEKTKPKNPHTTPITYLHFAVFIVFASRRPMVEFPASAEFLVVDTVHKVRCLSFCVGEHFLEFRIVSFTLVKDTRNRGFAGIGECVIKINPIAMAKKVKNHPDRRIVVHCRDSSHRKPVQLIQGYIINAPGIIDDGLANTPSSGCNFHS